MALENKMRNKQKITSLLVFTLALMVLPPLGTVRGGIFEVTNTNNSGPGSLRQAISAANNQIVADTITFAAATNRIPIVLAGAAGDDNNASGDLDIRDGGNLNV